MSDNIEDIVSSLFGFTRVVVLPISFGFWMHICFWFCCFYYMYD